MDDQETVKVTRVTKVQKSLLINEDLVRLLDAVQKRTGASFTRQVTAAVLQYLFTHPEGPDPLWMEWAVSLDDGEISAADMPKERAEVCFSKAVHLGQNYRGESDKYAHEECLRLRRHSGQFKAIADRSEKDPLAKIIGHWSDVGRANR